MAGSRQRSGRLISIHAPPRGATRRRASSCSGGDFNSRPSARGDRRRHARAQVLPISIHAPPRGATESAAATRGGTPISIHAPPRGATTHDDGTIVVEKFQFTPLREGRLDGLTHHCGRSIISIHAPPRGATRILLFRQNDALYFNSRPSARGDDAAGMPSMRTFISIHAPPRGATSYAAIYRIGVLFQFTPLREGRRKKTCGKPQKGIISIHAPPRGATKTVTRCQSASFYFNSRPSARGDGKRYAISANLLFNPYKSAWLNNRATQFVEIILVIFHRIIA